MDEPEPGQQVTGTVLETGQRLTGTFLGSYWWNRAADRCERASVRVHGREVTMIADTLELHYPNG